ncbi:helix-turn-helix domain-containing protein [Noviherbaspirillum aerium]|uniref:helix-turn-helix domain-containing protein n=1 Tax=Noviherbaspirillum aerium TaxID=2588497 RepID=UPI00178C6518|nr:helix-turn-helix domain-containing protein [Noviherbaspirillum aerium]
MRTRGMPSFGLLAEKQKDRVYVFGEEGFIFTSPYVLTPATSRNYITILITIDSNGFLIGKTEQMKSVRAAIVGCQVSRSLAAVDVKLVSINITPAHPLFAPLAAVTRDAIHELSPAVHREYDADLEELFVGSLSSARIQSLFHSIVGNAAGCLGISCKPPRYREDLVALLRENPALTLGELAYELKVSYATASRTFMRTFGLPLRSYQFSARLHRCLKVIADAKRLTDLAHDAGFADSAHFTRAWQTAFGMPPSYLTNKTQCDMRGFL